MGLFLLIGSVSAIPALSDYNHTVSLKINITPSMGAQTDYQIKLNVTNLSGISSYINGENVIFTNGTLRADFFDINLTDSGDAPLPFWVENNTCSAVGCTVWVKSPTIAVDNTSGLKVRFGNSSQTVSTMSILNTFQTTGDDFNVAAVNSTMWSATNTPTATSGVMNFVASSANQYMYSTATYGLNYTYRARLNFNYGTNRRFTNGWVNSTGSTDYALWYGADAQYQVLVKGSGGSTNTTNLGTGYNAYHVYEIKRTPSLISISSDGSYVLSDPVAGDVSTLALPQSIGIHSGNTVGDGATVAADWAFVRKSVLTEPTTSTYVTTVTSGGAASSTNFTQQDIWQTGVYNQTFTFTDSKTGAPIPVVNIVDESSQNYTTSMGTGYLSQEAGAHIAYFSSSGYATKAFSYIVDGDATHAVQLTPTSDTTKQQNTWYSPHQVRFIVWNSYGNDMPGITVNATANGTSLPSDYLENLYGIEPDVANQMLNGTLIMQSPTGADGAVVFTMHGSVMYRIQMTNPSTGKTFSKEVMPIDDQYILRLETSTALPNNSASVYSNLRNTTLTFSEPNISYVTMGLNFTDTSGTTTSLKFYVKFANNQSVVYTSDLGNPGTATVYANYTMKNIRGTRMIWNYTAVRS